MYKKYIQGVFITCVAILVFGCAELQELSPTPVPQSHKALIGTWLGIDSAGEQGGFSFNADGSAEIIIGTGIVINTQTTGQKITWHFDPALEPKQLDIWVIHPSGETGKMLGIVRFIDENTIEFRNLENTRPRQFLGPEDPDTVILKRYAPKN